MPGASVPVDPVLPGPRREPALRGVPLLLHRVPRALTADLMRFRAYAEMTEAQSGTDGEREQQADEPRARHDEGD